MRLAVQAAAAYDRRQNIAAKTKKIGFKTVVWILAIAACLWSIAGPIALNAWARSYWKKTPCNLQPSGHFFYDADGKHFMSSRTNFWTLQYKTDRVAPAVNVERVPNATCWVSPSNPDDAVLHLDAWQRDGEATGRFATAIMVLAAAALITLFGTRRQPDNGRHNGQSPAPPRDGEHPESRP